MSIQHCPAEILDMIFQLLPIQSPDKAPAALLPTMLTCSRFCAIAKRHLIRIVCLQTTQSVNLFAAYLKQLTRTGAYGKALLPIVHMAVFGERRVNWEGKYETEWAAARIFPFIISIAAPSLRSLTVYGFKSQYGWKVCGDPATIKLNSSIRFPNLQRLVFLHQQFITLHRRKGQNEDYLSHCYPQLTSLFTHCYNVNNDVLALRTLRELRLDMLQARGFDLPIPLILHLKTIIIDSPPLPRSDLTRSMYEEEIADFIQANSSPLKCIVVVTEGVRVNPDFVLYPWKDIAQGGSRCWKKGLEPTTC